jgi:hypothetical protein
MLFISLISPVHSTNFSLSRYVTQDIWSLLDATNVFTIRQHVKLLPKYCCKCPPCVPQENSYSIYAGLSEHAQQEVLRVDEVSDDWNRCCCKPYHPIKLEVRQYIPVPGDGTSSDYGHLSQDFASSWTTMSAQGQYAALRELYRQYPPVMTIIRHDGQRCCRFPCRVLDTFVCFHCCQDGVDVFAGQLEDEPKKDLGRPYNLATAQNRIIGSVTQPIFGGWCYPTLHLREGNQLAPGGVNQSEPFGKLEGPCIFGGWSEMWRDFNFPISHFTSKSHSGDLGKIVKKKPTSLAGGVRSLLADNNSVYSIEFDANEKISAGKKTTVLAAQLLADYMYFDGNTEKCDSDENAVYCYICYCSIIGALIPCTITIPKNGGN